MDVRYEMKPIRRGDIFSEYIGCIAREQQSEIDTALAISVGIEKRFASKGELFETCLCPQCARNFKDSGYIVVKKRWQAIKGDCDFCKSRLGMTFGIFSMGEKLCSEDDTKPNCITGLVPSRN